ncbi:unnamed protein product [Peronospora belbahrii]|uniref:Uncharacterized protein n=1 Tax=Peronospora belbahrii TaxID=622444 RepID=A0AAU9KRE0_9STRA|nr:unnamed protein product [Peronospora belbahrii]CAH0515679.1 unnamed protein product [Peronospora belbahrii]
MIKIIQTEFHVIEKLQDQVNDTSKAYHVPGFKGQFGFITSMTCETRCAIILPTRTFALLSSVAVKRKKFVLGGHGDMYGLSKAKNRPMILIGG